MLVLTVEPEKHRRLSAAIASLLSPEQQEKVLCLQKDEFDAFLESVSPKGNPSPPEPATEGKPKMVKGWKVRTNSIPAPIEDLPRLEKEMAATMAENLRRGKTKKREKKGGAST